MQDALPFCSNGAPVVVEVNALIGGGKATYIANMADLLGQNGVQTDQVLEDVDDWESTGILGKMYEDPAAYLFPFQLYAAFSMMRSVKRQIDQERRMVHALSALGLEVSARPPRVVFRERSTLAANALFVPMSKEKWGPVECSCIDSVYGTIHEMMDRPRDLDPHLFVYLRVGPDVCHERMLIRGREAEKDMPKELNRRLEQLHDDVFGTANGWMVITTANGIHRLPEAAAPAFGGALDDDRPYFVRRRDPGHQKHYAKMCDALYRAAQSIGVERHQVRSFAPVLVIDHSVNTSEPDQYSATVLAPLYEIITGARLSEKPPGALPDYTYFV